jgi:hypothetical protein
MVFKMLHKQASRSAAFLGHCLAIGIVGTLALGHSASAQGIIFGSGLEVLPGGTSRVISGNESGLWLIPNGRNTNLPNFGRDSGGSWNNWGYYHGNPPFLGDDEVPIIIHDDTDYHSSKFTLESEAGDVDYYLQPSYGNSYYQGSLEEGATQWWEFSTGDAVIWYDQNPHRQGNQWKSYQLEAGESYVFRMTYDGRRLELYRRS